MPALLNVCRLRPANEYQAYALHQLRALARQTALLSRRYDVVVANPPYLGSKAFVAPLKRFTRRHYPESYRDLYACFVQRGLSLTKRRGHLAMITMHGWMSLSSFTRFRAFLFAQSTLCSMVHLGARAFESLSGDVVQTTAFVLQQPSVDQYVPVFYRLLEGGAEDKRAAFLHQRGRYCNTPQADFDRIPGRPVVYWLSKRILALFHQGIPLGNLVDAKQGLSTGNNDRFLRRWWEVARGRCGFGLPDRQAARDSGKKWFPHNKGGRFRKWYGNQEYLINWEHDGRAIRQYGTEKGGRPRSAVRNDGYYFREALTWSYVATFSNCAFRLQRTGTIHDAVGPCAFSAGRIDRQTLLAYCNTPIVSVLKGTVSPSTNFSVGPFKTLPILPEAYAGKDGVVRQHTRQLVDAARQDWDAYERSWDFQVHPLLAYPRPTVQESYQAWLDDNQLTIKASRRREEENNRLFLEACTLSEELSPAVPLDQVTLTVNPAYRYRSLKLSEADRRARFLRDTMAELVSYAVGCMMGRYSLDTPGLVYAESQGRGFDPDRYVRFAADDDGLVPITKETWFEDDAAGRFFAFVEKVWGAPRLKENVTFIAESLLPRSHRPSRETLRHYFSTGFYPDHLSTW